MQATVPSNFAPPHAVGSAAEDIRIMHVVLSMDAGGLEQVVLSLLREAPRLAQHPAVLCVERPGKLAPDVEKLGATVYCADKPAGMKLSTIGTIGRLIAEFNPHILHTHQIGALFYAGPAGKKARVPVAHTEHGKHYESSRKRRWLARWSARYARKFFCVSKDIADAVSRWNIAPTFKTQVVENGIDTARFAIPGDPVSLRNSLGIPPDALVIGTVGRLAQVKRQDLLLRGFHRVPAINGIPPHLVIVGSGPLQEPLQQLATELGLAPRVHFPGYQADPAPFLHVFDLFALTSDSEGMPLSVLEAWSAGLAVVTSRVGGLPQLVDGGKTGILFEPGDAVGLAQSLTRLLHDHDLRRSLGAAGKNVVQARFDVSNMSSRYHNQYLQIIASRGQPASRPHAQMTPAA